MGYGFTDTTSAKAAYAGFAAEGGSRMLGGNFPAGFQEFHIASQPQTPAVAAQLSDRNFDSGPTGMN